MISRKMSGLILAALGICFVVSGTIMFLLEPLEPSNDSYCGYCMVKRPIYCYKTLHGILFDTGWLLTIIGSIITLAHRKQKLRQ